MAALKRKSPQDFSLPPVGVDTHAHLDLKPLRKDVPGALHRAKAAGLAGVGNVFLGPQAYRDQAPLFADHPEVFFILGIHPHEAASVNDASLAEMESALQEDGRIKALGETGLDFFHDRCPRQTQKAGFQAQLRLARELDLPVVIHSRDADEVTVRTLLQEGFQDRPLVWHCFGREASFAEELLSSGWMISLPGIVTFSKAAAVQEAVARIPLERMVLETDCPFLAPEPFRGKTNEPAYTAFTAARIAELSQRDIEEVWRVTASNAAAFFGL
jgi:TatD DNase family protein